MFGYRIVPWNGIDHAVLREGTVPDERQSGVDTQGAYGSSW